ncbi:hypothetical protein [Nocardia nepalensis]|uniref:hypothetical protein n=1 Tax=Nocardia nepalensis TaxID=3375448 RepID=UPI003B670E6C
MTTDPFTDSGRLPAHSRKATRAVVRELTSAAANSRTGVLRVAGDPGGDLHLRHGKVVAVRSPGAPGVPELLARPGRGSTGEAELRLLEMMTALDGAFAIAAGWIDNCFWKEIWHDPSSEIAAETTAADDDRTRGVEPDRLIAETERRLRALARVRVSPHRNILVLTDQGRAVLNAHPNGARAQILREVNGRNCCRDIAFSLRRGLFAIAVEVSRLLEEGILAVPGPQRTDDRAAQGNPADRAVLPRRRRGASGINDMLPPRSPQPTSIEVTTPPARRRSERMR